MLQKILLSAPRVYCTISVKNWFKTYYFLSSFKNLKETDKHHLGQDALITTAFQTLDHDQGLQVFWESYFLFSVFIFLYNTLLFLSSEQGLKHFAYKFAS